MVTGLEERTLQQTEKGKMPTLAGKIGGLITSAFRTKIETFGRGRKKNTSIFTGAGRKRFLARERREKDYPLHRLVGRSSQLQTKKKPELGEREKILYALRHMGRGGGASKEKGGETQDGLFQRNPSRIYVNEEAANASEGKEKLCYPHKEAT